MLRVEEHGDHGLGRLRLRIADGDDRGGPRRDHRHPTVVHIADAYGSDSTIELHVTEEITIDTHDSGGWYDIALTTPNDASFSYQVAGRLESAARLTSDPQLGGS